MGDGHRVAIIETDQQGTVSNWGRDVATAGNLTIGSSFEGAIVSRPI
jgi:hypothetical protein